MLASSLVEPTKIEIIEIAKPDMKPGEVLVRLEVGTICGSDLHMYHNGVPGLSFPMVAGFSGHEIVGAVEDSDSDEFKAGDRVLIIPKWPPDAFTQWIVLPPANLIKLPDGPPLEELVVGQQLGTVIHATRRFPNITNCDVVVLGQGPAGLLFDMMLVHMGVRKIIGIDIVGHRLDTALKVGATHVIDSSKQDPVKTLAEITDGKMCDVGVEAVGEPETFNLLPDLVREGAYMSLFGIPPRAGGWEFDFYKFFRKQAHTISTFGTEREPGMPSFKLAMDLIALGRLDVKPLVSHKLPLKDLSKAFQLADLKEDGAVKVVLDLQ